MPTEQDYAAAVQAHLDETAQGYGYDSIHTAVSYADSPEVPAWMEEGRRFRRWRSRCWAHVFALMAEGATGTPEELVATLPPLFDQDAPAGEPAPDAA